MKKLFERLSLDLSYWHFTSLSLVGHINVSIDNQHTDAFLGCAPTTHTLCRILVSTLALADTQDASCYKLFTPFISMLSLRYSHCLRITAEQLYCCVRVDDTLAFLL